MPPIITHRYRFLPGMLRRRVDLANAQASVNAVRNDHMFYRQATTTFGVSINSINNRLKGRMSIDGHSGASAVHTMKEEGSIEASLLWTAPLLPGGG